MYRAEKKKILRSQIDMIILCQQVLAGAELALKYKKSDTEV